MKLDFGKQPHCGEDKASFLSEGAQGSSDLDSKPSGGLQVRCLPVSCHVRPHKVTSATCREQLAVEMFYFFSCLGF